MEWLAARTRSRFEKTVAHRLDLLGISSYVPLTREKRHGRIFELVLLPGYCFVQTSQPRSVLEVQGVCGFVTFQSRPAPIPEEEIAMLKEATDARYNARESYGYSIRQAVKIVGTPFDGFVGTVDSVSGPRVRVILPVSVGKSISIEIQSVNLEPLPSSTRPHLTEIPCGVH